jgi:Na+-translocating ferredoxin:NAD+ oxidoreductase RnfD subunit
MTIVLAVLLAAAAWSTGTWRMAAVVAAATLAAAATDAIVLRAKSGRWSYPSGAVLSGLFVAMVLSTHERWHVAAAAGAIAVISKYLVRGRTANVLNPAAAAIVLTFHVFHTGQDWWGALPESGLAGLVLLIATGVFITDRVNKAPLVLSFLAAYFLLFTIAAFASDPRFVAEVFREPDINAVLFFAFFILTDPPTSPNRYRDQVVCGVLVAIASFAIFEMFGVVYYLLAGVLAGNVWEGVRRRQSDARRVAQRARTFPG